MADDNTTLNEYKSQLAAVEQALQNVADDQKTELIELKCKLSEVICLLQGNQEISEKKSKNANKSGDEATDMDAEFARFQMEITELEGNSEDVDAECKVSDIDDEVMELISSLEGSKCRAPFSQQWGEKSYHNAIVFSVESCGRVKTLEDVKVKVMFCNPVCEVMKPCPYFLDGHCKFAENKCRYSHGFEVDFLDLQEFSLPNYSNLQRDSKCLARYQDGLWYRAIVESCLDDQKYLIKYDTFGDTDTLDVFNILPLEGNDNSSNDVGSESDTNSDDDEGFSVQSDEQVLNILPISSASFGEWEQYTKGMGSKLMAKMGYIWGQGLGKNGEGRIEPVEAIILPAGKSLDKCIQLRDELRPQRPIRMEDKLSIEQDKEQERVKKMKNTTVSQHKKSVFDFINSKLSGIKGDVIEGFSQSEKTQSSNHKLKASVNKDINLQSFAIAEDIKRAQKELSRLQEVLMRNRDRNKIIQAQVAQKIDSQNTVLKNLQAKEYAIQQEMRLQRNHKKLSIF